MFSSSDSDELSKHHWKKRVRSAKMEARVLRERRDRAAARRARGSEDGTEHSVRFKDDAGGAGGPGSV